MHDVAASWHVRPEKDFARSLGTVQIQALWLSTLSLGMKRPLKQQLSADAAIGFCFAGTGPRAGPEGGHLADHYQVFL